MIRYIRPHSERALRQQGQFFACGVHQAWFSPYHILLWRDSQNVHHLCRSLLQSKARFFPPSFLEERRVEIPARISLTRKDKQSSVYPPPLLRGRGGNKIAL